MTPGDTLVEEGAACRLPVLRCRDGRVGRGEDWVAEEMPVALAFNGISHAVMLATPADLEDFALGFALAEGLLDGPSQCYGIEVEPGPQGLTLQLRVAAAAEARLKARRRTLAGRTGCGLCGLDSLEALACRPAGPTPPPVAIAPAAVARAMRELAALQPLNRATGAVHAAAWCARDGAVRLLREDVGRHNALDKLIGALARPPRGEPSFDAATGFVAVTSRASVEMVQKALVLGAPLLAAVSAPTALAVRRADEGGLSLVGFARGDDLVAYTHPGRLGLAPAADAPA